MGRPRNGGRPVQAAEVVAVMPSRKGMGGVDHGVVIDEDDAQSDDAAEPVDPYLPDGQPGWATRPAGEVVTSTPWATRQAARLRVSAVPPSSSSLRGVRCLQAAAEEGKRGRRHG